MNDYTYESQNLQEKNMAPRVSWLEALGIFDGSETMSTTTGEYEVNNYVDNDLPEIVFDK